MGLVEVLVSLLLLLLRTTEAEHKQSFDVEEGVPVGTVVGTIGQGGNFPPPPYLIVPQPGSPSADADFNINPATGLIRTRADLDRERAQTYSLSAIPASAVSGSEGDSSIRVVISVGDINDNTPTFPKAEVELAIPENTPRGTRRKLSPAVDADLGSFGTQRYEIVSGNEAGAFILSDQSKELELIVNEDLDREKVSQYSLQIVAMDGGSPTPRTGTLTVRVLVQDLNDNPPLFGKQRYFTTVSADLPVGASVLSVRAEDADDGDNGRVSYSINRRQSDREGVFRIDEASGLILLDKRLDLDRQGQVHEVVVVARDGGEVPQETSAFVTVRLSSSAPNNHSSEEVKEVKIRLNFVTGRNAVPESAKVGETVAFISVSDPAKDVNLELAEKGAFEIVKNASSYVLRTAQKLDFHKQSTHKLTILERSQNLRQSFEVVVEAGNDHAPVFDHTEYQASLDESAAPGTSVVSVRAVDPDGAEVTYSLQRFGEEEEEKRRSDWFTVDEHSGLVTTQTFLDCETESNPRAVIVAQDSGFPRRSASVTLSVSVRDVNDHRPIFESAFYSAELSEDKEPGECFITVEASDLDCGINSEVFYKIKESSSLSTFRIEEQTGRVCLDQRLDRETQESYGFTVVATDKGGLSTSTMVKVEVMDVNDNTPEFKPSEYKAKISSKHPTSTIVSVMARDRDSGKEGEVFYSIEEEGNEEGHFQIDSLTGAITLTAAKEVLQLKSSFRLTIGAVDGGGFKSPKNAAVEISVSEDISLFETSQFSFSIPEDVSPYSDIGRLSMVAAKDVSPEFTIIDASVNDYISIDPMSGVLRTEARLDHETNPVIVLNVRLEDTKTNTESFCQVIVNVEDVNDNAPDFGSSLAVATVKEDFPVGSVIYHSKAVDADKGRSGEVTYGLQQHDDNRFTIESATGNVLLAKPLDFETQQEYALVIEAADKGVPPLNSTLRLVIHVHDVNDNEPKFEQIVYEVVVSSDSSSSSISNAPVGTVRAKDADSGRNGRVSYFLPDNPHLSVLQNSGVLLLKQQPLLNDAVELELTAKDHGQPTLQSSVKVRLVVSDSNDHSPTFEQRQYSFTVALAGKGSFVGTVKALDEDDGINGVVAYNLKADDMFVINKTSGMIYSSSSKELEKKEYELVVEAMDGGQPRRTASALVKVVVEDKDDDNAPILVEPVGKVLYLKEDSAASGTMIGKLVARDPDSPTTVVTFQMLGSSDAAATLVSVAENGEVRLLKRPSTDAERQQSFQVRLSDGGSRSRTETLRLILLRPGENIGSIPLASKTLEVDSHSSVGSRVGSASVSSSSNNLLYSLSHESFLIDAKTGNIFTTAPLEDEDYDLIVKANSVSGEESPVTIEVKVRTGKQQTPALVTGPITFNLSESIAVGTSSLLDLTKYSLQGSQFEIAEQSPGAAKTFGLQEMNLVLVGSLDYEQARRHLVVLKSSKQGDIVLVVEVVDANDNAPVFLSTDRVSFPRDSPVGSPLFKIIITDPDSGLNGEMDEVTILEGNDEDAFVIKEGSLQLAHSPTKDRYELVLLATDKGNPPQSGKQKLSISFGAAVDDDGKTLKFRQKVYQASVIENAPKDEKVIAVGLSSSSSNHAVKYSLLKGQEYFHIDEVSGEIVTTSSLDREVEDRHALVVLASDAKVSDTAVVFVAVEDANDNAPKFGQSCKDLSIPENSQQSYIHAFVASDDDLGENGRVSYSMKETVGFRIERDTGKLHAIPMDREERDKYSLEIIAVDNGSDKRTSKCEITIRITDLNDNDPSFTQSIYSASVREDIAKGTEVLRVSASDPDEGENAEISYSMENATAWSFAIDEKTGSIFSTDLLDREEIVEHRFDILATDKGRENIRSSRTQVRIILTDANDHEPQFSAFPFRANMSATPDGGNALLRLSAHDPDAGPNGQLTYNIVRPEQRERFQLSPEEGVLTVVSDVKWEPGTAETLEVAVSDAGSPPRSSTGLVQILIEGGPAVTLAFQESHCQSSLTEHPPSGVDVAQVRAVRSDGRRQRVIYTFLKGNELGAFEINSNNGLIRVRDPELVDYERQTQFNLTISGQGLGDEGLTAYTSCVVKVGDLNDNTPKFSREVYNVKVLEGSRKGSRVLSTKAIDLDKGQTDKLKYDIIEGNVDGAFVMDPDKPGTILTNTVLDREIRDSYQLTISATDSGVPALVGLAQVIVQVIDVNDNRPHFAPAGLVKISRDSPPGSVVTTLRANDVDLAPLVTYRLEAPNDFLSVNTFTGQLMLLKLPPLTDHSKFKLAVIASDTLHEAKTEVEVTFEENDRNCRPSFQQPLYTFFKSHRDSFPSAVGQVEALSCGSTKNVVYEVSRRDQSQVSLLANGTAILNRLPREDTFSFIVTAMDAKTRKKSDTVVTVVKTAGNRRSLQFDEKVGEVITLPSHNKREEPLLSFITNQVNGDGLFYTMSDNPLLDIDSFTGKVYLRGNAAVSSQTPPAEVTVTAMKVGDGQTATKTMKVVSSSQLLQMEPEFAESAINASLSESSPLGTEIDVCRIDSSSSSSRPLVKLHSGGENYFSFDANKMKLILNKNLDHSRQQSHSVLLKIGSSSLCTVNMLVVQKSTDHRDSSPFPVTSFVSSAPENAPVGTAIRVPLAAAAAAGSVFFWSDSDEFSVNELTGEVSTKIVFDYETRTSHHLTLRANSTSGRNYECKIEVLVESRDEFPPAFERTNYHFNLAGLASVGDVVGQVRAKDRDAGADGFVTFQLLHKYFNVDPNSGVITVSRPLDTGLFEEELQTNNIRQRRSVKDISLVVKAKSNQPDSLEASTTAMISVEESVLPVRSSVSAGMDPWLQGVLVGVVLLLIVLVVVIIFICKRRMSQQQEERKIAAATGNMSLEMTNTSIDALSRFPPQYSEIVSDYDRAKVKGSSSNARSELSEKSHRSASSGRGSVEDCEEEVDVEIRMINEGNYMSPDAGSTASFMHHDEDKLSESSVQNTEEYLARLGIDIRKPPKIGGSANGDTVHNFDTNNYGGSSIYNRIPDDAMSEKNSVRSAKHSSMLLYGANIRGQPSLTGSLSSIVHSEEELAGSYNWDYLLDWGPQYQPLAHVFKEISRLKDDDNDSSNSHRLAASFAMRNPHTSHLLSQRPTRSPISHETSLLQQQHHHHALSPSFHPALSPLATKSPSVSPLSAPMKRNMPNQRL